jgi:hypothetical protein
MKGFENRVVQNYSTNFNQVNYNTTLIYDDRITKTSIPAKIPEEYGSSSRGTKLRGTGSGSTGQPASRYYKIKYYENKKL